MTGPGKGELVAVAGASRVLGREVLAVLRERGYRTRALSRDPEKAGLTDLADEVVAVDLLGPAEQLRRALEGVNVVFSSAGQSTSVEKRRDRRPFAAVDLPINLALLEAAQAVGVRRFVYVSVLNGPELREVAYTDAHERVVEALEASGIEHTVIRANAFFDVYRGLMEMARKGPLVSLGDPQARSNPIHEADLAAACVDALEGGEPAVAVGGPQVLTRREADEVIFAALGRRPRIRQVPRPVTKALLPMLGRFDPRRAQMLEFVAAVTSREMIAPAYGERRLEDYLRGHAEAGAGS